jgi:hypothetical protein
VHSLWVTLWKQKNFSLEYGSDLRKRCALRVEEIFFCRTFIHSLHAGAVDEGTNSGMKPRRSSLNCDEFHTTCPELTPVPPGCMQSTEYAVDNSDLA